MEKGSTCVALKIQFSRGDAEIDVGLEFCDLQKCVASTGMARFSVCLR
jgi:hypothetical protein